MMKILILPFFIICQLSFGQTLYNPQLLYDAPSGLFDTDSLRTISINFYDSNYDSILQAAWTANSGISLPATVQLSNGIFLDSVATRYKGNSTYSIPQSLGNPKLPLSLDMNDIISGQKLMDYKKLKLANALFDPTFCKELSAFNIYRRYLPTPEGNFLKVNVQGNYVGLYVNTESVNKQFLKKHFDEKDGVLFKCDPIQQFGQPGPTGNSDLTFLGMDTTLYYNHYDLKSDHGWEQLRNLITILNFNPSQIDTILNVDRVLWAFAANQVVANLDTYNGLFQHNYYLYQTGDGLFQMIPWDLSESFVGALLGYHPNKDSLYYYDPYYGYNCYWYPLITQLISNTSSEYSKIYTAHLRTIIDESLDSVAVKNYVSYLQGIATAAATSDTNKLFGMPLYYYNVDNEIISPNFSAGGIVSTVTKRKPFLQSHPEISKIPPNILSVQLIDIGGIKYVTTEVNNEVSVQIRATTSIYNSRFQNHTMYDDGSNGDLVAGDKIYTALLPFQSSGLDVKFYVRAFNADAVKFNPERAEYEFYIYNASSTAIQTTVINPNALSVYPNPSNSYITLTGNFQKSLEYELHSVIGERLMKGVSNSGNHQIDLSGLLPNIYFLRIGDQTVKIIKTE